LTGENFQGFDFSTEGEPGFWGFLRGENLLFFLLDRRKFSQFGLLDRVGARLFGGLARRKFPGFFILTEEGTPLLGACAEKISRFFLLDRRRGAGF